MTATHVVRQTIRSRLTGVTRPDSRFHLDCAEFTPDVIGSDRVPARPRELNDRRTAGDRSRSRHLLNQSSGYLDYGLIRAVAVVSVILWILFFQAVALVEHRALARAGTWGR